MQFPHLLFLLFTVPCLQAREWTNTEGKSLQGDIITATQTHVEIKFDHNNKHFTIPVASLIKEDQNFITQWLQSDKVSQLFHSEWPSNIKAPKFEITTVKDGPQEYIYQSKHYEFITDAKLTKVPITKFAALFEASRQYLQELPLGNNLAAQTDVKHKIYLFESKTNYIKAGGPPNSAGVFIRGRNRSDVLVPFQSLGLRKTSSGYRYDFDSSNKTLAHEITHQVTDPEYYQEGARGWYTEGLAEYIAITPYNGSTFTVTKAKNELKDYVTGFSKRINRGRNIGESFVMPSLEHYMNMDYSEFTGSDANQNYGISALLFIYFAHFEGDKQATNLKKYLQAIKEGSNAKDTHSILFADRSYQEVQDDFAKEWRSRGVRIKFH